MGRAERRWRQAEGEPEQEGVLEAEESFAGMEFDEDDVPRPRRASEGNSAEAWEAAHLGTADQVALLFQVHRKTVERWRREAGLPFVRAGGVIRYDLRAVLEWAAARTREAGSKAAERPSAVEGQGERVECGTEADGEGERHVGA